MRSYTILIVLLIQSTFTVSVQAIDQAFCSLRDPNREIFSLFPEADTYRSIVRVVSDKKRIEMEKRLPFELHFSELGQHTLYLVQSKDKNIGLVHMRSEASKWGLIEVAWALDLDLNIRDFIFVRCRDRNRLAFEANTAIRAKFIGANYASLSTLLTADGSAPNKAVFPLKPKEVDLGMALVRNGLKTIIVTETVWAVDLEKFRLID